MKKPSVKDLVALRDATTHPKLFFPKAKLTKGDLVAYYEHIAPLMLPFMKDHPVSLQRYPDGITGKWFYQKNMPDYFPEWLDRSTVINKDGTKTTYVLCQNRESLMYIANQACITPHIWLSTRDKPQYPDRIIFDLDPGEKTTFKMIQQTALRLHELLDDHKIPSFVMTTGSRGLHIIIPIKKTITFETSHAIALYFAKQLLQENPTQLTLEIRKNKRHGKMFIDTLRNTYGHTSVVPYAVRPLEHAPIATPLLWKEVADPKLTPQLYTIATIFKRLKKVKNVWKDYEKSKIDMTKFL